MRIERSPLFGVGSVRDGRESRATNGDNLRTCGDFLTTVRCVDAVRHAGQHSTPVAIVWPENDRCPKVTALRRLEVAHRLFRSTSATIFVVR